MSRARLRSIGILVLGLRGLAALALVPVAEDVALADRPVPRMEGMDLSAFSKAPPSQAHRLLFIHHSCGGQLLAAEGPDKTRGPCLYESHPNGGGLRNRLGRLGYEVHEASYGSELGERTDLFDWLPKFQSAMSRILACDENDRAYSDGRKNEVVVWKSCFPNNAFQGEGQSPGDPRGPDLTVWNAKATFAALLPELARHPEVLFVYLTAPPLSPDVPREPAWKRVAQKLLGRASPGQRGAWAREFNRWVVSPQGWLAGYPGKNVVVFDYYDLLTKGGASDFLAYRTPTWGDSHPSREGNERAAESFCLLLNRALRRAGLQAP
jgi:hypothetical protein